MTFAEHFQQALVNLLASKLRSFLAVLGILVGTAAVVALISCGQLATEKALAQFKTLGTDLLSISTYQKSATKSNAAESYLPLDFWRQIPERIPSVKYVAPYGASFQSMSYEGRPVQAALIGADESLAKIIQIHLARGNFVSFVDTFEHFCVIGDGLARQLQTFRFQDPLGKQLQIGQMIYTIIGVAKPWAENAFFNEDINQSVIVPLAGMTLISKDAKINNAVLLLEPDSSIDNTLNQLKHFINLYAPKLSLFSRSPKQIIASMESQGQIFTLLLALIGAISLLVGGIGIMNIMLVSVSERKKEIGIRKAVGAKNKEIQQLFIAEAIILSVFGGVLGVVLGLIFTFVESYFSNWSFKLYLLPPLVGFAVSTATGVFSGYYPAKRASRLDPMASLRSE